MITSIEKLRLSLKNSGIELSRDELEKIGVFLSEVKKWSQKTTIVSKRIGERELLGLVFDSLILKPEIHGSRIADLGSGGGFPGIPLAITLSEKHFTLVEIVKKKCIFLDYVTALMGLENVSVECISWDELKEKFDTVVSMGTGLDAVSKAAKCILSPGGKFIYVTSKRENCHKKFKNPFIHTTTCLIVSRETIRH